jgi:hypothetical protein
MSAEYQKKAAAPATVSDIEVESSRVLPVKDGVGYWS